MNTSNAWKHLVSLFGLASTGCGMVYVQHGYYESWGLPGWSYSLEEGTCTFFHQSRPDAAFQLRLTGDQGRVGFLATVDLPEGESFRYEGGSAWVTSGDGRRQAMPVSAILRRPRETVDSSQAFDEQAVAPGQRVDGATRRSGRLVGFRTVHSSIELGGRFDLAEGQDFTLELPRIAYGNEVLPAFQARFHWHEGTLHLLRHVQ